MKTASSAPKPSKTTNTSAPIESDLKALGGCDPEERWNRGWDGKWRIIVFDLPEKKRGLRNDLRKQLRSARFGGLQRSVWISPGPFI